MSGDKVGSVLVFGAGIGGMQSAKVMADSGFKVYLVEGTPSIGGRMTQLDKTFPTNECSMCTITPVLVGVGRNPDIVKMTTSTIQEVRGEPGNFEVDVKHMARYVDMDKCTGCSDCAQACPVSVIDTFNMDMGERRAAYIPFPQAVPLKYVLDRREASPCKVTCPANLSAQGYVALIGEGRYKEALEVVKDVMPFAGTIGRVCNHLCEESCKRGDYEGSVSIRTLKRFIADWERQSDEDVKPTMLAEPNGRKIAVVGGGCAGLTCAYHLARLGYTPTVFEAQPVGGGMLRLGIPDYRLPAETIEAEIEDIVKLGVEIKYNMRAGKDFQVQDLMDKDGFEAVFLAVGLHTSMHLGVEGEDAEGIMHGVEFLRAAALKEEIKLGKKVIVIGGGNVAVDVARTAVRLGVEKVDMVCLEKREQMPAHSWEVEEAEDEGVEVHTGWGPLRFITDNNKITGIELKSCTSVFDGDGKFCPEYDESQRNSLDADNILVAIGQGADIKFLEGFVETGRGINISTDQSTNVPGVFAGGDITYGPKMAIDAINSGRMAAWEIDRYLNDGKNSAEPPLIEHADIFNADYYKPEEVPVVPRNKNSLVDPKERATDFREIEVGYSEEEAKIEANRCLSCGVCARCGMCEIACQPKAINYREEDSVETLKVGALVVAAGFDVFESNLKSEYGYGTYKNVISAMQYERIMAPTGPNQGHIKRPSDHATPKKVAWLQCVGSRDLQAGNEYCSAVCCTYATKEAIITREDIPDGECTIFFMDMRTFGKGFEEFYNRAKDEYGVKYVRARVAHVEEVGDNNDLLVTYRDEDGTPRQELFDLVVLSSGLRPRKEFKQVADMLGIELNEYGFVKTGAFTPMETNMPGIFVSGAVQEPKDIPDTVAQSLGVAAKATAIIHEKRGTELTVFEYPPEIDIGVEPRIGVFVCHCGVNIGSVVDVPKVAEFAKTLPNVVYAENNLFTCSQDTQEKMKEIIKEHNLNRVVVASCTPRTHEPLFQETLRSAGVNQYLFDLVSIREHCSWVHREVPDIATEKAKRVISMSVEKVSRNMPVSKPPVDITSAVLIIGGGIAGMNAALDIVNQDFDAYLVEKEPELGGNMRNIPHLLTPEDPQVYLRDLIKNVESHPNIHVYKSSKLAELTGFIGNFEATIGEIGAGVNPGDVNEPVKIGSIIVSVGAKEYKPNGLFRYGEDPRIMTQIEFDKAFMEGKLDDVKNVVMIQCVGSREGSDGERPYCSRVCCTTAVKNALRFTDDHPERQVLTLYRDIRTYGYKEKYYREARGRGMVYTRYLQEAPPEVTIEDGKLKVEFSDLIVNRKFTTYPDLVVLSAATVPFTKDNIELAQMLKVPLTLNNFFLEAHTKIAPVDFAADGIYMAGTCHSPKFSDEAIFQASAAAAKAMSVISRDNIDTEGIPSMVDEARCVGCGLCEANCAYNAIVVNPDRGIAEVNEVLCKGCGACQAVCPSSVPYNRQFGINQIMRMIETATDEGGV